MKNKKSNIKKEILPKDIKRSSVLLDKVPWVGFYQGSGKGNPEDHPLPSVMRSLMEYLGDDLGLPYFAEARGKWQWETCAFFHGITGSGFAFAWKKPHGESYLGKGLMKSYDNAFEAARYDHQTILRSKFAAGKEYKGNISDDENEYRRLIVESIHDRQLPVVAIGVLGPEEPCLISGYEQDGKVIIGWNYFQDEHRKDPRLKIDPDGRFVLRDWFRDTHGIILVGNKLSKSASRKNLYKQALNRDLALLCKTGKKDDPMGSMSYQAWIDYLLKSVPKSAAKDPKRIKPLYDQHNNQIGELAERRAYASSFLHHAAKVLPDAAGSLQQAGNCHMAMHDMLWRVWQTLGAWNKTDDAKLLRFTDPKYRNELASLIRRLQAWDLESAKHIHQALRQLGASKSELPDLPEMKTLKNLRDLGVESPLPGKLEHFKDNAQLEISGIPELTETHGLAGAIQTATKITGRPITGALPKNKDLLIWATKNGWQLKLVKKPFNEHKLAAAKRINDVILSCLYGLPVATTYDGKPALIVGYNHLAGQKFRVRLPGQTDKDIAEISINDKSWGPEWIYMTGRL